MKRFFQNILILLGFIFLINSIVLAEDPESFLIKVEPDSFGVGESVDLTISAIKNGEILKSYMGDIFISIEGLIWDNENYVVPGNGFYSFMAQDQGTKLFSKGLTIKKSGTYKIIVEDALDENIIGKSTIFIGNNSQNSSIKYINITSPINGSTEYKSTINVIGSCFELKNSPIDILVNGKIVANSITNTQGSFNIYVSNLSLGENKIQAKITDINGLLLGESPEISVNYNSPSDDVFNSIEVIPSENLKQGDMITFSVYTSEFVNSVEIKLDDGSTYPLDRISPGVFQKDMTITVSGPHDVSLSIIVEGELKIYDKVASFLVKENKGVGSIKFVTTGTNGSSVLVSWQAIGDIPKYRISYGKDKNSLEKTVDVHSTEVLIENLQIDSIYFFQITPLDNESHSSGEPSEIVEYSPQKNDPVCVVKGITVRSEKIGEKYFLIWDQVENVIKYEIYRSDREDMSDIKKVGETTDTTFEYFFDKYTESDQYAYYQVKAICNDGSAIDIDQAQKVKVGPVENILLIFIITLFLYSIYKLYRFANLDTN